jgi:hypothetical protein
MGHDGSVAFADTVADLHNAFIDVGFPDPGNDSPWLSWDWVDSSWNLLEIVPQTEDPRGADSTAEPHSEHNMRNGERQASLSRQRISSIIDAKVDPVELHRQAIVSYLQTIPSFADQDERLRWLSRTEFQALLKTYFLRHHRHTPIVHLPTFSIAETPTSLIFALALIAAAYTPSAGLRAKDTVVLARYAYRLALDSDQVSWTHIRLFY